MNLKLGNIQLQDPKQKRLAIIAAAFFVAAGFLYWKLFFSGPSIPASIGQSQGAPAAALPKGSGVSEESLKRVYLDTDVVKTDLFKELRLYGDFPILIPTKGNPAPFEKPAK